MFNAIITIIFYLLLCLMTFFIFSKQNKTNIIKIVFISLLFLCFNYFIISVSENHFGDRYNYYIEFLGVRKTSIGLMFIYDLVKAIKGNFNTVYLLTTFFNVFTSLFVIDRICDKKNKKYALLFLLLSDYFFFGFAALKQIYVCILANIIFLILAKKESKIRYFTTIALACLAPYFHVTGYFLFFIVLIMFLMKRNMFDIKTLVIFTSLLSILSISLINYVYIKFQSSMPLVSLKINEYILDSNYIVSIFSFIKGIPFYITTFLGLPLSRNKPKDNLYHEVLILSFIGSIFYIFSIYSYWLYRISYLFLIPCSILFGHILQSKKKNKATIFTIVTLIMFLLLTRWILLMYINYGGF